MDSVLYRVYQEPATVAKIRTKREARQQKAREKALHGLQPGDRVDHDSYGFGIVLSVEGQSDDPEAKIEFGGDTGIKHLVLRYAPIKKL